MSPRPGGRLETPEPSSRRPWLERAGLAAAAILFAILFVGLAAVAWAEGEVFLAVMAGIGGLMTIWAAAGSLARPSQPHGRFPRPESQSRRTIP